jgi:hypothetical protein
VLLLRIDSDAVTDPDLIGMYQLVFWEGLQGLKLKLKLTGMPQIITIQEADPRKASEAYTGIPGSTYPFVILAEISNS